MPATGPGSKSSLLPDGASAGLMVAEGQTALSQLREIQIVLLPEPLNLCQPWIQHPRLSVFVYKVQGWRALCNGLQSPQVLKFSSKNSVPQSVLYSHQKTSHVRKCFLNTVPMQISAQRRKRISQGLIFPHPSEIKLIRRGNSSNLYKVLQLNAKYSVFPKWSFFFFLPYYNCY